MSNMQGADAQNTDKESGGRTGNYLSLNSNLKLMDYIFIQAITNLETSCKYSENGCQYAVARADVESHEESCLFRKIECPHWECEEKQQIRLVIDHLKTLHGCIQSTNFALINYVVSSSRPCATWEPLILSHDGHSFLFNCIIRDFNWSLWLSVLGDHKLAEEYRVKITLAPNGGTLASVSLNSGKVYSTDTKKVDVFEDAEGILEVTKNMAKKVGDVLSNGDLDISVSYQIMRVIPNE